jgi:gamma-glutamyltranspeptidase/glutathione hydrolase
VFEGKSTLGGLAVGVPGTVAGLVAIHEKFGTIPWEELVQPAIDLALDGYLVTEKQEKSFNSKIEDFISVNGPETFYAQGFKSGDRVKNIALASTLKRIAKFGKSGFYVGETANDLVNRVKETGGIISHDDLLAYKPVWRDPINFQYKDLNIFAMGPPSSGGICLGQILKMIEPYDIGQYKHNSIKAMQIIVEAERRSYADRSLYLGDPDFYKVPEKKLLNTEYLNERMETFEMKKATPSSTVSAGTIPPIESQETTHLSVVDPNGNAVSITTTLNSSFGSKVLVEGAGFFLNNEMDDFSSKPGVPNQFGLIGGDANAIAPHKRMLSSMTPTIVTKNGKLKMVVGTPGGSTIITSVYQTLLNVIDFGMGMQEAVNAKKVHHQWYPDEIRVETSALAQPTIDQLQAMGHSITPTDKLGRMDCILILPDGRLEGGADPRGDNTALGF